MFDSALVYARTFQGLFNGRTSDALHIVGGRGVLTTGDVVGARPTSNQAFDWMRFDGSPGTSFGADRGTEVMVREGEGSVAWSAALVTCMKPVPHPSDQPAAGRFPV